MVAFIICASMFKRLNKYHNIHHLFGFSHSMISHLFIMILNLCPQVLSQLVLLIGLSHP